MLWDGVVAASYATVDGGAWVLAVDPVEGASVATPVGVELGAGRPVVERPVVGGTGTDAALEEFPLGEVRLMAAGRGPEVRVKPAAAIAAALSAKRRNPT